MTETPWTLPWTLRDAPHALVDILRGCDIVCPDCYNRRAPEIKPVARVLAEVDELMRRRPLQSVALVGGEILLHPGLEEIIREIRRRSLYVELFTNALRLDERRLDGLAAAGTNLIFAHIQREQRRPDLPSPADLETVRALWAAKTEAVAARGMDAGLALTLRRRNMDEGLAMIRYAIASPHVRYVLITLGRATAHLGPVWGDLETGLRGARPDAAAAGADRDATPPMEEVASLMRREGLRPFAALPAEGAPTRLHWLSYVVGWARRRNGRAVTLSFRAGAAEAAFVRWYRRRNGKYPFFLPHQPSRFRLQAALQCLHGGRDALRFWQAARRRDANAHAKRILFQQPATIGDDGRVIHCRACPDAVLIEGRLVPACLCDCWQPAPA